MSKSAKMWRMPDDMWSFVEHLLPKHDNTHPCGGGRPRKNDRDAMDAIFHILRTGAQWNSLNASGICSSSTAHRRFQAWTATGVFEELWTTGLQVYEELKKLNWSWLSMNGAISKAPLGWEKTGPNPTDQTKSGTKQSLLTEANGVPVGLAVAGANVNDFKLAATPRVASTQSDALSAEWQAAQIGKLSCEQQNG